MSLSHDFNRKNENRNRHVVGSVGAALAMATDKGMRVMIVSDLLNLGGQVS